jgi:hypothetical protein
MDFSKKQADPRRHLVGFTLVVLFHAAIVYALVTGLAKKVVDVVRAPIETKVIEEIKKPPPPPPEIVVPPPPKLEAPPPPYIPPPEVQIAVPPPVQPTVTLAPSCRRRRHHRLLFRLPWHRRLHRLRRRPNRWFNRSGRFARRPSSQNCRHWMCRSTPPSWCGTRFRAAR